MSSIFELKKSPTALIEEAGDESVAILNHNKPSAYLVSAHTLEKMIEIIDDYYLAQEVKERLEDGEALLKVELDAL